MPSGDSVAAQEWNCLGVYVLLTCPNHQGLNFVGRSPQMRRGSRKFHCSLARKFGGAMKALSRTGIGIGFRTSRAVPSLPSLDC